MTTLQLEDLSCPICLELYDYPIMLPCLHSFCVGCLRELADGNTATTIACPQCRRDVQVPSGGVENFPKNFSLANNVKKVKQQEEQKLSSNADSAKHSSSSIDQTQDFGIDPSPWEFPPPHDFPPIFHHHHGSPWTHHRPPGCQRRGFHQPPSPPHRPHPRGPHEQPPPWHRHSHHHHPPPPWHHPRGPPSHE
ncbi:uncharacterized protein LOC125677087 isoform X2 [Ostrea edulis]|uniref:uncharacterized protein LOC125677087 isoform X2 n=1 Tax=Ostrea edulis TaxID=37623 RepID=UPI0024AF20DF|nr:uncharacterized protein LOC125677087 isoform X2 [Ostrea edulis]